MATRLSQLRPFAFASVPLLWFVACGSPEADDGSSNVPTTGGTGGADGGGGTPGTASGGTLGTGSAPSNTGGQSASGGSGGSSASGGSGGSATDTCGGEPLLEVPVKDFDCGASGHVFENAGPADNRVNYIIVGDGYTSELLDTVFIEHIENMLYDEQTGFYSAIGEPYARYRKFINVCGLKIASNDACIDNADIGRSCDTPFDGECVPGCGSDGTRLGVVDLGKVNAAVAKVLPDDVDVDWIAATLNADASGWWNSGGGIMVWNGAFENRGNAASVARHEGGHTFHRLADEYDGTSDDCGEFDEVNSTADPATEKWAHWLGFDDTRSDDRPRPNNQSDNPYGTRTQGAFLGSRYCSENQYRPSQDSQMNLLPRPFNMPSVEKIISDIYGIVAPIDVHTDNTAPLNAPGGLQVRVVDPEVIHVEWSVDGAVVSDDGGECFVLADLASGSHTVTARAYDDTPWVRLDEEQLSQTVSWEVIIP